MDVNRFIDEKESPWVNFINRDMPRYYTASQRMHTMFARKCVSQVHNYQNCIGNKNW